MFEILLTTLAALAVVPVVLLAQATPTAAFTLTSPAFKDGQAIPKRHANKGVSGALNLSPALAWANVPASTKSLALACVDRHPIANNWVHWLVINIPAGENLLPEGVSGTVKVPDGIEELNNTFGTKGWGGPQPPPGSGSHSYEFQLYALSVERLSLPPKASLATFNAAVEGKVLATARLVGTHER
ncbi:MAG: YbhB/YbcL family Raf kinase inhibitor-like protein [Acidobacteriota bacterium]